MPHYVGLDVSQKTTAICVVDEQGRRLWRGACATDPGSNLGTHFEHAGVDAKVGIETGSMTPWLVHGLRGAGLNVECLDARQVKAALQMRLNKTDENDAEGLAQIMRTHGPCSAFRASGRRAGRYPGWRRWRCWPRDRYVPCPGVTCRRSDPLYNRSSALRPERDEAVEQRALYRQCNRSRPLVAVLDNGPIHTSKLTTKALAQRPWLTLEWLPKYAPELNDIERCWRDLKQHQLANRTFADADALARAIPDAVARLNHERQPNSSPIPTAC